METPKTLRDAIIWFADFEHCRDFMVQLRWPDGNVKCPRCGAEKVTFLEKQRVWKCYAKHERPTFSLKTGTIFEDSPIPLEKWLCAAWLLINCKNGISSYEIHRDLGVTQKTAWFMLHRLRLVLKTQAFVFKMGTKEGGGVEVDETFVGGKLKNMHRSRRIRYAAEGGHTGGATGKAVVQGILDRDERKVRQRSCRTSNAKPCRMKFSAMCATERRSTAMMLWATTS